jgi:cell wall-associated NlpC family hydrolase
MRSIRKLVCILLIAAVVASTLILPASAEGSLAYGAATVSASSLNIRTGPDTTYPIVATVNHNAIIVILEKTSDEWFRVNYNGTEGYVASMYLTNVLTAENFSAAGTVAGNDVIMRDTPSTSGNVLGYYNDGTSLQIIGINNGWYKVKYNGSTGYMRSDFMKVTSAATPSETAVAGATADSNSSIRQQIVDFAMQYVGYSYVYGGSSPSSGFDCSGLFYYVFHQFNYSVTRTASSQYAHDGTKISKSELLPGDLVFFSSNGGYNVTHVGIYIGNNEFVHASTPKIGVVVSSLDSTYYTNVWYGAKRVLS